jgi:hypothetical protein
MPATTTEEHTQMPPFEVRYHVYGRDAFGWPVGVAHHLFAPGADARAVEEAWRVWLDGVLVDDGRSAA